MCCYLLVDDVDIGAGIRTIMLYLLFDPCGIVWFWWVQDSELAVVVQAGEA